MATWVLQSASRQSVWWPGLATQFADKVKNCIKCCKNHTQRAEPLLSSSLLNPPWQKVDMNLFKWKRNHYLLIVDYFSRFIEISKLIRSTSEDIIAHTKSIFARHGIPEVVYWDNGPKFRADDYEQFSVDYEFKHVTSSPYFPPKVMWGQTCSWHD